MKFTSIVKGISLTAMVALLAACGGTNETTESDVAAIPSEPVTQQPAPSNEVTDIRFTWWGDTLRHDLYEAIVDLFEERYPDVRVIREPASWGDYWTRLATQTAGGNAPHVFGMHPQFISDYALRGVLYDLTPFLSDGTIDTTHIADATLNGGVIAGQQAGIPKGITLQAFGINRSLLGQFGLEAPSRTTDWTWDEFTELATDFAQATAGQDYTFVVDHSSDWVYFRWFARQAGGDIFTSDGTDLGFNADTMTEWFTFWNDLRDMGAITDAATSVEQGQLPWQERRFAGGLTALQGFPANQLLMQHTHAGLDLDIDMVRVPMTGSEAQRAENLELPMLSVFSNATPEEAYAGARLINFFVNTKESMELFLMEQGVPVNYEMVEHITPLLEPSALNAIEFVEELLPVVQAGVYPPLGAGEIDALFRGVAERVLWGQITPEQASDEFFSGAAEVLGRN